ncbi:ComEA family DNA-binding protein [Marinobacterium jannaschii]|uniref:ComEA family DNA-binding protein n=1 Tax=Marinobacterium jannaschii TaxID=64970 RepID=UPI0009FE10E9|nr:helix-hairpin-helix domain-containing protein [Marinobacterium jannaschii]
MSLKSLITGVLATTAILFSAGLMAEPVNINTASAEELAANLSGIGMGKAAAIVEYRNQHGDFSTVEALTDVKGIGKATLEKNRHQILLQAEDKAG